MTHLLRSAALTGYIPVAQSVGVDPYPLLSAFGFSTTSLSNPDAPISGEAFGRLLEATAVASGVDDFGLRLSETRELADLGALGLLVRDQATFADALTVTRRYLSVHTQGVALSIEAAGELAIIRVDVVAENVGAVRQAVQVSVGTVFRLFKSLLGSRWTPVSVCFRHGPTRDPALHRRFFGCPVDFGQDFDAIVVRATDLDAPILRADPAMARHTQKYLDTLLRQSNVSTTEQVRRLATVLLPSGVYNIDHIARHLDVDYRTVQRRLAREGQSFSAILDDIRDDLATRHIAAGDRSLTEISELLGFSALSAFSRWFRGRHGCSAKAWRAQRRD